MIKNHTYRRIFFVFIAVASIFFISCATVVKPTGGEMDRTPPKVVNTHPSDSTIRFNAQKIILEFDEFIKLNNPRSQVLINPFIGKDLNITTQGKKIIIKLPKTFDKIGTYHIFFGNAVQDITENNIATNLHYVFSTGDYLDSCNISGYAINAFENTPNSDAWLLLHKNKTDVKDTVPLYLVHANEKGFFQFSNLKPGTYHAFALVDANSDYKFNLATELIGFYPEPIELNTQRTHLDSIKIRLFENIDMTQKKIKSELIRYHTVRIGFKQEMKNPEIEVLKGGNIDFNWDENKDTVLIWVKDRQADSLGCIIRDGDFSDTIYQAMNVKLRFSKAITDTTFSIKNNLNNGKLAYFDTLTLVFSTPIIAFDTSHITLSIDSLSIPYEIKKRDEVGLEWAVIFEKNEEKEYRLIADRKAFTNVFKYSNDSTAFSFTIADKEDFGSMSLTLSPPPSSPFIVQINGSLYQEKYFEAWTDTVSFYNLLPGNYNIKLIIDKNENGKYTTGDFDKDRQPEPVFTLPRPISVKENFESKMYWSVR